MKNPIVFRHLGFLALLLNDFQIFSLLHVSGTFSSCGIF